MKKRTLLILGVLIMYSQLAQANLGIAFSSGQGIQNIVPYRFAFSWDVGPLGRKEKLWGLNLIWESSFALWDGPKRADLAPDRATDLNAITSGPMFRWQRREPLGRSHIVPYSELGVGFSWLSETEIEGRILSLHFQFEDKFGLGMKFGSKQQYDVAMRLYHYSNASIKRPNSGVNLAMVSFGIWFPSEKV
jgi:lipid A 3-O-deacylase